MKRLLCLTLALICLSSCFFSAQGEKQPAAYIAVIHTKCNLRREPDTASYRIVTLEEDTKVEILEYGEEWCSARYGSDTGFLKTDWLCRFRSLDPYSHAVPGYVPQWGLARAAGSLFVNTEDYDGTLFPEGALFTVQSAEEDGAVIAMARSTARISDLFFVSQPFADWQRAREGEVIYAFTTYFNDHFAKKYNEERIYNITVGCERINGVTVAPGESFSFNALCWPYKKSNGYQYAPNISKEGYGYGGGVCQVSTTLYNCLLGLPLQIDKWAVHRDRGVSYARQYFDSAVGNYSDLAFTNTLPYAVTIHALPQGGVLTVYLTAGEGAAQPEEDAPLLPVETAGVPRVRLCDPDQGAVPLLDEKNGQEVISLPCGITVDLLEEAEDFCRVGIAAHEGWVPASRIYREEDAAEASVSAALLVRTKPDKDADSLTRIAKGGKVTVYMAGKEWAYVSANGAVGYVLRKYLKGL